MSNKIKYPHTSHLPWSPGTQSEDKLLKDVDHFKGMRILITEKMDGENTTMYNDHIHARSMDSIDHPSRHYVKGIWGGIRYLIPDGWRICGENIFAKHSIFYDELDAYFQVFSVWNENNECLSWHDTCKFCKELGLTTVPTISCVTFDEKLLKEFAKEFNVSLKEGFVIRNYESFHYDDFELNVAKWVRSKHVQTSEHWLAEWRNSEGYVNKLKDK